MASVLEQLMNYMSNGEDRKIDESWKKNIKSSNMDSYAADTDEWMKELLRRQSGGNLDPSQINLLLGLMKKRDYPVGGPMPGEFKRYQPFSDTLGKRYTGPSIPWTQIKPYDLKPAPMPFVPSPWDRQMQQQQAPNQQYLNSIIQSNPWVRGPGTI